MPSASCCRLPIHPVVSNYNNLKAFVIGMMQKKRSGATSEKGHRVVDDRQHGGTSQFELLPSSQLVQQTSAWSSPSPQFGNNHVFTAIVDNGLCRWLQINMINESEVYGHTGEWILAAISAISRTPAIADANKCIPACTNCDTSGGLFPPLLCG